MTGPIASIPARGLRLPLATADQFVPTRFSTAEDKAKFCNDLLRFIAEGFPRQRFTKALYSRLSHTFGHIAHYNANGFWSVFFEDTLCRLEFLKLTVAYPCYGDPRHTFRDVEELVRARLRASDLIALYQAERSREVRQGELDQLARLIAKHGVPGGGCPPAQVPLAPPRPAAAPSQLGLF